jgi:hypothetical protein
MLRRYLPEYRKLFEILPGLGVALKKYVSRGDRPTAYSSQNFR